VDSDRVNRWLTLGANVAVLVGLIFLIVEIRQNGAAMRAQTRAEISYAIIDNIKMGMDPMVMAAYEKRRAGEPLSLADEELLDSLVNATFRLWENTHYQYRSGLFDDDEFQADLEVWRDSMQLPEFRRHWQARRLTYSKSFRDEIDKLVE